MKKEDEAKREADRRAYILLKACRDLLKKQRRSSYTLNLLEEPIYYDNQICDGLCLLEDIIDFIG